MGWNWTPFMSTRLCADGRGLPALKAQMNAPGRASRNGRRRWSMFKNNDDSPYDVGFSKPPEESRFRKGVSGNPKGRPKGRPNIATVLERTLQEKVVINENGVRKTVTKLEAAIKQLMNKAA